MSAINAFPGLTGDDMEILQALFLNDAAEDQNEKQSLDEHHVVLKVKSSPTKATKIWKEYVRFAFGKRRLSDQGIHSLKALQESYYKIKVGSSGDTILKVSFWVSLETAASKNKLDLWTEDRDCIRYIKIKNRDVEVVRASDECLRDEVKNNGGRSTLDRRSANPRKVRIQMAPQPFATPTPASPVNTFALEGLERLKERALETGEGWVNESSIMAEKNLKQYLLEKLESDLTKYESLLDAYPIATAAFPGDAYHRHRQELHSSLLVGIVNTIGNGMVEWYEEDHKKRKEAVSLSSNGGGPPSDGLAGGSGHDQEAGRGGGNGGGGGHERMDGFHQMFDFGRDSYSASDQMTDSDDYTHAFDDTTTAASTTAGDDLNTYGIDTIRLEVEDEREANNFDLVAASQGRANALRRAASLNLEPTLNPYETIACEDPRLKSLATATECPDQDLVSAATNSNQPRLPFVAAGNALHAKGDHDGALLEFKKALALQEESAGLNHHSTAEFRYAIGKVLHDKGHYDEAQLEYGKAMAMWQSVLGKEDVDNAAVYSNIGNALSAFQSIAEL